MKRKFQHANSRKMLRRPATIMETVMALGILFLLFFGMLQICEWTFSNLFCQYSAFYTAKAVSLGYQDWMTLRGARVAAIGISGPRDFQLGNNSERELVEDYMLYGDASQVWYKYWGAQHGSGPQLQVRRGREGVTGENTSAIRGRVFLENAGLLHEALGPLLSIQKAPEPSGLVRTADNAIYLEE